MKIKQAPGDFVVEEVLGFEPEPSGRVTLYRLRKSGIGTLEALRIVGRAWGVRPSAVSVAGLKDRYGDTLQWVGIEGGAQRSYQGRGFDMEPGGFASRPLDRSDVHANRFGLRVRDLSPREAERARERAIQVGSVGFANYFDDQRFGSMRATPGALVLLAWLRGDSEEALRLAIATPSRQDRSRLKARRRMLQQRWGQWAELAKRLDPSTEQRICRRLAQGASFEEAYLQVDRDLRSLHLSAWQAWVFNAGLRRAVGEGLCARGIGQEYVFYPGAPGELEKESIPLVTARAEPHPLLDVVLEEQSVQRSQLAGLPLRRGLRGCVAWPQDLEVGGIEPDAANTGRHLLPLSFTLGRGSYATMLLKRIAYDARSSQD